MDKIRELNHTTVAEMDANFTPIGWWLTIPEPSLF